MTEDEDNTSSRVVVQSSSRDFSEASLEKKFSSTGLHISDMKVLKNANGQPRGVAFIGFRSIEDARSAKEHFDNTWYLGGKLKVQYARKVTPSIVLFRHLGLYAAQQIAENLHSQGSSQVLSPHTLLKAQKRLPDSKEYATFPQFKWHEETHEQSKSANSVTRALEPDLSDQDYLSSRRKRHLNLESEPSKSLNRSTSEGSLDLRNEQYLEDRGDEDPETIIRENGRLFLRNLPFDSTQEELQERFSKYGPISEVNIPTDLSAKGKGFAFIGFEDHDLAWQAFLAENGTAFKGRILHILPSAQKREVVSNPKKSNVTLSNLSKGKQHTDFHWSSLYMNPDAVAESVVTRLGISKEALLNEDTSNAAVRLALAETQTITETKDFLKKSGVDLNAFASTGPRSSTTLLLKNIPYNTSETVLRAMVSKYGNISRLLLPPTGTIALVQMEKAEDTKVVYRSLAYQKVGNSVLYLEKAPEHIWLSTPPDLSNHMAIDSGLDNETTVHTKTSHGKTLDVTLYVKNLSFSTTTDHLLSAFNHLTDFSFARVQMKPTIGSQDASKQLSMGYGFIGFRSLSAAQSALSHVHGYLLDGHVLEAKFAKRSSDDSITSPSANLSAKIVIKNVPFEASKKDLHTLLSAHGQIKSLRLPKKLSQGSRGFAFAEFVNRTEAETVIEALKHTHLLGRHLILEFADSSVLTEVEELRQKAKAGQLQTQGFNQKSKLRNIDKDLHGSNDV